MSESVVQIVTAIANRAAGIALSTPASGVPQTMFTAEATTNSNGIGPAPTHCWANGWMDDAIVALFEAQPATYTVTRYPNRNPWPALSAHVPVLYPYLGTGA